MFQLPGYWIEALWTSLCLELAFLSSEVAFYNDFLAFFGEDLGFIC